VTICEDRRLDHGPKMLAIDIDGTMLRTNGTLSERVLRALHEAVRGGIHVVPSTGRPEVVAKEVIEATGLNQYWVFGNGAVTRHLGRDELVRGFWIEREVVLDLMTELRSQLAGVRFAVEFGTALAYESGFEHVVPNMPTFPPTADLIAEVSAHEDVIQKVLVFDTSVDVPTLFDQVRQVSEGRILPTYSGLNFIELAAGSVSKASALGLLADDLGIQSDDVWAIGDNYNDIEMLKWAGVGYAMGNADDHIKSVADAILPTNDDDGVAVLIERLLG